MCDRLSALIFSTPSIMPKDPTEKQEKKRKEKKEKKKKEVVEEAPVEAPTTDVPEDVEMDDNAEDIKVYFSRRLGFHRSGSCTPATGDEKIKEGEEGEAG